MKRGTREWVRKAEADYRAALREMRAAAHDLVCFLAQQSVEKYLKALLEENGIAFPKTHDLHYLANLATPVCPSLRPLLLRLRRLSDSAVRYRYPGAWATASQARVGRSTLQQSRKILRAALALK